MSVATDRRTVELASSIAMRLFVAADSLAFAALLFVYIALLVYGRAMVGNDGPSLGIGLAMTACLAAVSVAMVICNRAAADDRLVTSRRAAMIAALLGLLFVGGQVAEYMGLWASGYRPDGSLAAAGFYVITGYHGLHVFVGVVVLGWILISGRRRPDGWQLSARCAGIYWHFVDIVWLFILVAVYARWT